VAEPSTWLEVSLVVDGELAEAVAEVLSRFVPNGVAIEATRIVPDVDGEGRGEGPFRVCGYLEVGEAGSPAGLELEETRQRIEEALWYLGRVSPLPPAEYKMIQQVNWVEAWKQHYHPIQIGQRLVVLPAWIEEVPAGRIPVRIEPGMAFGTGTHPTTQLCLAVAETWVQPGRPVIDVGCGSGILSVAALKLGASYALGVDIDPEAIPASQENALLNGILSGLQVELGSIDAVQRGDFPVRQAPLVFANILAPVIIRLLDEGLGNCCTPGGALVLSGILAEQEAQIRQALGRHNLQVRERSQIADWICLVVSPQ
jgi:ribosomal protein L11 methyltransferase